MNKQDTLYFQHVVFAFMPPNTNKFEEHKTTHNGECLGTMTYLEKEKDSFPSRPTSTIDKSNSTDNDMHVIPDQLGHRLVKLRLLS